MLTQTPQWVAVYTAPKAEKTVTKQINEDLHLETYLPLHPVLRKWSDRIKRVEVPLIPSYTFVRLRECDIYEVRGIKGVCGFVRFRDTGIATIRDEEIEALRRLAASEQNIVIQNTNQLHSGAQVAVVAGEFAGMNGTIVKDCPNGNFSIQITNLNLSLIIDIQPEVLEVIQN